MFYISIMYIIKKIIYIYIDRYILLKFLDTYNINYTYLNFLFKLYFYTKKC